MALTQAQIDELAAAPLRTTTDEGTVEERSAKDIIALNQHAAAVQATDDPLHGLRISRCKPAGP